jgi:RNA polymerase sigma factor (sigma-70 family)
MRTTHSDETDDWRLLRRYARDGSQDAFGRIVERHINLVYATCRRELGDPSLADDVTQVVFLILARKAGSLMRGTILSRWLFKTARFASRDVMKREARRKACEVPLNLDISPAPSSSDDTVRDRPLAIAINCALEKLSHSDWEAVQLRFYEDLSLREIGEICGTSEDTAQKRVSRAVDRIRRSLLREGIGISAIALGAVFTADSARALTPGMLSACASQTSAAVGGASIIYGLTKGVLKTMAIKNLTVAAVAVTIGAAGTIAVPMIVRGQSRGAATAVAAPGDLIGSTQAVQPPSSSAPLDGAAPSGPDTQAGADRAKSISNLKLLALAIIMYAADHQDTYPHANKWVDEVAPYAHGSIEALMRDPSAPTLKYGYAFNAKLSGVGLNTLPNPAYTVLVFESTLGVRNASDAGESVPHPGRHLSGTDFAYAEGHVKWHSDSAPKQKFEP